MNDKINIKEILKEKKPIIDKTIEKHIPRKFTKENLEEILGKPRYKYPLEAPQKSVADPFWEFLDRGGKRWRPTMLLLVNEALGGNPEEIMDFVVIPEVIHNSTLLHDDLEDKSDYRRGKPVSHKIFGEDITINLGDVGYFLPFSVLKKNKDKFDKEILNKAYELIIQELINVSFGQAIDIAWHNDLVKVDGISEEEYFQMCNYKTGCLARLSAKLGALLAGAKEDKIEKLGRLASTIGIAFQLEDDILDLTGEEFSKGKGGLGKDIEEGKRTLMVIHTLENGNEEDKSRLLEILNKNKNDQGEVREAIEILKKYDSIEYAKQKARKMVEEAWTEAEDLLLEGEAKDKLRAFANYLIEREI